MESWVRKWERRLSRIILYGLPNDILSRHSTSFIIHHASGLGVGYVKLNKERGTGLKDTVQSLDGGKRPINFREKMEDL
jgi:hypothetical protein